MKVVPISHSEAFTHLFQCPACGQAHGFRVPPWTFNGDYGLPTVGGSIRVQYTEVNEKGEFLRDVLCHSYIRDGMIEYLADCTHAMAGQTTELPDA